MSSAALPHSHQRLEKGSHKKLFLPHVISYCSHHQQLLNTKGTRSSNKVLTIALGITILPVIISGETEAQRGTKSLVATQRASGQTPSSFTDALSYDHPSRPYCLTPGKNKKQVCDSAAYKTV